MSWQAWLIGLRLRWANRRRAPAGLGHDDYVAYVRRSFDSMVRQIPKISRRTTYDPVDDNGVKGRWLIADGVAPVRTLYYLHGGGYVWGSPDTHSDLAMRLSRAMQARVFLLDYRLAPEHPCPAAIEDAVAGWHWLLKQEAVDPASTVIAGDSAGGGLSLATLVALRDAGAPLPAAGCLIAPWADLTGAAPSIDANDPHDPILSAEGVRTIASAYHGELSAGDPKPSPLFAPFDGLPPLLIQVGSREILHDDSMRLAEKVRAAGGTARLDVWPKMPHVWHMIAFLLPEARKAIADMAAFAKSHTAA